MMLNRSHHSSGFTLLELLIAIVVIGLGLMALVKSSGETTAATAYLREKTMAHWVAMNRMEELRIDRSWPRLSTTRGEAELFGIEWTWSQETKKTTLKDLRRVEISVYMTEHGDEDYPLVKMIGFLVNPKTVGGAQW